MKRFKMLSMLLIVFVVTTMFSITAFGAELTGSDLKVVSFSSEHASDTGDDDYRATLAVDGNTDTFWANEWAPLSPAPHSIVFDLGKSYSISGFKYMPRQDGYAGEENGNLGPYEIYVSDDNANFTKVASGKFDGTSMDESAAKFDKAATGRYFKLVKPTGDYIGLAEIKIEVSDAAAAVAAPAADTSANPKTGDNGIVLYALLGFLALASFMMVKKLRFNHN